MHHSFFGMRRLLDFAKWKYCKLNNYQGLQSMADNYFIGPIYHENWIDDCVREKRFI